MNKLYVSEIIGNPIYSSNGELIGRLKDVVVASIDHKIPHVRGFILKRARGKTLVFIPDHDVDILNEKEVRLATGLVDFTPFERRDDEVLLTEDVFDKQIVDIDDRRITRVNDLQIGKTKNVFILTGVDVSPGSLLYRLGLAKLGRFFKRDVIPWEEVQFLGGNLPMKVQLHFKNLESLHPVDLARIIFEGPGYKKGTRVITSLKDQIAADIVEELSPMLQKKLVEDLPFPELIDIVKFIEPDKAADLLLILGSEMTQKILEHLPENEAKKIKELLTYPENTAGAYMNPEFIAIPAPQIVSETFAYLRELAEPPEFALYLYVIANEKHNKLVGVLSAAELFQADPRSRISGIMTKNPLTASPMDPIKDTLKTMHHYNLSAIPVVGKEHNILGIVTYQDAASIYLPKSWKHPQRNIMY